MGLDMYMYKIQKESADKINNFKGMHINDISGYHIYSVDDVEAESDLFKDLMPYLNKTSLRANYYDKAKIYKDFNIPDNYVCTGQSYHNGQVHWSFNNDDYSDRKEAEFKSDDYTIELEKEFYLVKMQGVYYWRKAYNIQDFIHEAIIDKRGHDFDNTEWVKLDPELISDIIDMSKELNLGEESSDWDGTTEDIFYWEWY